jgi:hypothetical protein
MAYTVISQSSLTLSGSLQTIGSAVTAGKLTVCQLDLSNLVNGDEIEFAAYNKTKSDGSEIEVYNVHASDVQYCPVIQTPAFWAPYSITFKALQTAGSAKSVTYLIFTID